MDFKFNWDESEINIKKQPIEQDCVIETNISVPMKFLNLEDGNLDLSNNSKINIIKFNKNDVKISIYNQSDLENNILNNNNNKSSVISESVLNTLRENSDIKECVYEGGFTIWDGCKNLIDFLINNHIDFNGKRVIELGCGYGLPGIYSLIGGAAHVCFQDYNVDVIKCCTIPNVILNNNNINNTKVSFISGDWRSLLQNDNVQKQCYDVILTAETIYRASHYRILIDSFKHLLKVDGRVFLNTKSVYYGVGGTMKDFIDYVSQDGVFKFDIVQTATSGVLRYVVILSFK